MKKINTLTFGFLALCFTIGSLGYMATKEDMLASLYQIFNIQESGTFIEKYDAKEHTNLGFSDRFYIQSNGETLDFIFPDQNDKNNTSKYSTLTFTPEQVSQINLGEIVLPNAQQSSLLKQQSGEDYRFTIAQSTQPGKETEQMFYVNLNGTAYGIKGKNDESIDVILSGSDNLANKFFNDINENNNDSSTNNTVINTSSGNDYDLDPYTYFMQSGDSIAGNDFVYIIKKNSKHPVDAEKFPSKVLGFGFSSEAEHSPKTADVTNSKKTLAALNTQCIKEGGIPSDERVFRYHPGGSLKTFRYHFSCLDQKNHTNDAVKNCNTQNLAFTKLSPKTFLNGVLMDPLKGVKGEGWSCSNQTKEERGEATNNNTGMCFIKHSYDNNCQKRIAVLECTSGDKYETTNYKKGVDYEMTYQEYYASNSTMSQYPKASFRKGTSEEEYFCGTCRTSTAGSNYRFGLSADDKYQISGTLGDFKDTSGKCITRKCVDGAYIDLGSCGGSYTTNTVTNVKRDVLKNTYIEDYQKHSRPICGQGVGECKIGKASPAVSYGFSNDTFNWTCAVKSTTYGYDFSGNKVQCTADASTNFHPAKEHNVCKSYSSAYGKAADACNNVEAGLICNVGVNRTYHQTNTHLYQNSGSFSAWYEYPLQCATRLQDIRGTHFYAEKFTGSAINGVCGSKNKCSKGELGSILSPYSYDWWECKGTNGGSGKWCYELKSGAKGIDLSSKMPNVISSDKSGMNLPIVTDTQ